MVLHLLLQHGVVALFRPRRRHHQLTVLRKLAHRRGHASLLCRHGLGHQPRVLLPLARELRLEACHLLLPLDGAGPGAPRALDAAVHGVDDAPLEFLLMLRPQYGQRIAVLAPPRTDDG